MSALRSGTESTAGRGGTWPRYCEAYAAFDVIKAVAAWRRGEPLCAFVDEKGRRIGEAFIVDPGEASVTIRFEIGTSYLGFHRGTATFKLVDRPNGVDADRKFVLCPKCGGRKSILVFVRRWACASCHRLKYRKQLISPLHVLWEQIDNLEAKIGKGRPHGMHQRTYTRLRAELRERKIRLGRQIPTDPSIEHSYVIRSIWMSADNREFLELLSQSGGS